MAVKTDTLLMLGGLGLLGFGMFYMMKKQSTGTDSRVIAATDAAAAAAGVQSQAQYNQMLAAMQQMVNQVSNGQLTEQQAKQQLTAQYVGMGIQGAVAIVGAIGDIFKKTSPAG